MRTLTLIALLTLISCSKNIYTYELTYTNDTREIVELDCSIRLYDTSCTGCRTNRKVNVICGVRSIELIDTQQVHIPLPYTPHHHVHNSTTTSNTMYYIHTPYTTTYSSIITQSLTHNYYVEPTHIPRTWVHTLTTTTPTHSRQVHRVGL